MSYLSFLVGLFVGTAASSGRLRSATHLLFDEDPNPIVPVLKDDFCAVLCQTIFIKAPFFFSCGRDFVSPQLYLLL
jgi:hypothetical protein